MQKVDPAEHEGLMNALDGDEARPLMRGRGTRHRSPCGRLEAADRRAGVDYDAQRPDLVNFLIEQLRRKTVSRNSVAELPAGLLEPFEDLDLVAVGAQVVGHCATGGAGTDDTDALACIWREIRLRVAAIGQAVLQALAFNVRMRGHRYRHARKLIRTAPGRLRPQVSGRRLSRRMTSIVER